MAIIHVNRAGQNLGQFSEQALSDGLSAGTFLPDDLGWCEGMQEWQPLSTFADLPPPARALSGQETPLPPGGPVREIQKRGKIAIGECWNKAWECFLQNWGLAMVATLIFFAISVVVQIPVQIAEPLATDFIKQGSELPLWMIIVGGIVVLFFWILSSCISAILTAGFFYFLIEALRNKQAKLPDFFIGFREGNWIQLLLAMLVWIGALIVLSAVMGGIGGFLSVMLKSRAPLIVGGLGILIVILYCAPAINFVLPLIVDRKLGFWEAIVTSFKTVHPQWFRAFGLVILSALVTLVGLLACCVGLIATMPLGYLIYSQCYRQLFGDRDFLTANER